MSEIYNFITGFLFEPQLEFVRIYFDTPAFSRITKDRNVKFSDMLASFGGTLGLFTGFSIISGAELLYFCGKVLFQLISESKK